MRSSEGALVLFSGGQDSTTCLAWALDRFGQVETVGFDYGQRHRVELACRSGIRTAMAALNGTWAAGLGEEHTVNLASLGEISSTALTRDVAIEIGKEGLPNTFVPGRNLIFLTIKALQIALNLGMEKRFVLHTPLMWIDKAATWELARTLGGDRLVDLIVKNTHTCYQGDRGERHDWGYGCGFCPACELRAAGFERFRSGLLRLST
jgi:7-cyano-7-deazaguanine synthase